MSTWKIIRSVTVAVLACCSLLYLDSPAEARGQYGDTFCNFLGSEALNVLYTRRTGRGSGGTLNGIEEDLTHRIPDLDDRAEALRMARTVWNDHTTPERDIPGKVLKTCREANGLPDHSGELLARWRCDFLAQRSVRTAVRNLNKGMSLQDTRNQVASSFSEMKFAKYFSEIAETVYHSRSLRFPVLYQVALRKCAEHPALIEIRSP